MKTSGMRVAASMPTRDANDMPADDVLGMRAEQNITEVVLR